MENEVDLETAKRKARSTGLKDAEGREINAVGEIFALNPATNNLSLPDKYRDHPFVADRYFYTLPSDVLELLVRVVGEDRFDTDLLKMEQELSKMCGDHAQRVGFWRDVPIVYAELREAPLPKWSEEMIRAAGLEPAKVDFALRTYQERSATLTRFARGYCGWLLTNRPFLDEHDALLSKHAEVVQRWGTMQAAALLPADVRDQLIPGTDPHQDERWPPFAEELDAWLLRWRLAALAGPYLPVPAKPLMAGAFPMSIASKLMGAGGVFYLPDTMPIPSRDQLRGMIDNALHKGDKPEHLAEWLEMVDAANLAKNRLDPYMRYFELQHYWRVLHERHRSTIHRKFGSVEEVLAGVLGCGSQQVKRSMNAIRKKLGKDWLDRPWPLGPSSAETVDDEDQE